MEKVYISDYPLITGVKRFYYLGAQDFSNFNRESSVKQTLVVVDILHENAQGVLVENLTHTHVLVANNDTEVYSQTGDFLEYDNTTEPPTLLHVAEKGVPIGQFDFFQILKDVPTIYNQLVRQVVARADSELRLNKFVK
jgi:hypothetical protein